MYLLRGWGGLDVERVVGLLLLSGFSPLGKLKKTNIKNQHDLINDGTASLSYSISKFTHSRAMVQYGLSFSCLIFAFYMNVLAISSYKWHLGDIFHHI